MGRRLIYDIETDGLLDTVTKIHCIAMKDLDSNEVFSFADHQQTDKYPSLDEGLAMLESADLVVGHNIVEFDDLVIHRFNPTFRSNAEFFDTQVIARAAYTNTRENDFKLFKRGLFPAEFLKKPHSLGAWGARLGNPKGSFAGPWTDWTQDMHDYMLQDISVGEDLYRLLAKKNPVLIETEMAVALYLRSQKQNGFPFDVKAAQALYSTLVPERHRLEQDLLTTFKPWYVGGAPKTQKRTTRYKRAHLPPDVLNEKGKVIEAGVRETFYEGSQFTPVHQVEFNPASRDHIAHVFMARGWKPQDFTDSGKPEITDDIIGALPYPEAKAVCAYLLLDKRIGALAEGKQAWMGLVTADGFIHGSVNQTGTPTHRASHYHPNMTQVPSVDSPYGVECRSLFIVPPGFKQVGVDVSGLELRGLAHFMNRFDGGAYMKLILEGDVHTANWNAGKPYLSSRPMAKEWMYAFLYGAGDWKLGHICRPLADDQEKAYIGRSLRAQFLKNVPALGELVKIIKQRVKDKKPFNYVTGHEVYPKGEHSALNYLIQSWGALVCKRWIFHVSNAIKSNGLVSGWHGDYASLVWAHDELQNAVRELNGAITPEAFGQMLLSCITPVQDDLKLTVPLEGSMKVGLNWADCH